MTIQHLTFGKERVRNEILKLLQCSNFSFQHVTHQETMPHKVAKEIGVDVCEGIKCLIMRGKKSYKNYLACVLGHQKVDMRALSALVGENCELEKIETIKNRFGLDIGGIPPFGNLLGIDVYFDTHIQNCKEVIFSCGPVHESIRMKLEDLIALIRPRLAALAQNHRGEE
jgi:nondiscriminating aspartyl-tRNA synthetase